MRKLAIVIGFGLLGLACASGGSSASSSADLTTDTAAPKSIADLAHAAAKAVDPADVGHGMDETKLTGDNTLDVLKAYIKAENDGDDEGYTYLASADRGFQNDEQVAGIFTDYAKMKADILSNVGDYYESNDGEDDGNGGTISVAKIKASLGAKLDALHDAGAAFAFDGFGQNGCAAPTSYLIVLDVKGKAGYGVDLNPCSES